MEIIRHKYDLIDWFTANIPKRYMSVTRHLVKGSSLEFLGGFKQIPPGNNPGWIFLLANKYIIAIISAGLKLHFCMLDKIPWKHWEDSTHPLYQGDNPDSYRRLKENDSRKRFN